MTDADSAHADNKVAKRRAIAAALLVYDGNGGLAKDRHARTMATAHLVLALRTSSERVSVLLADALAQRAADKLGE